MPAVLLKGSQGFDVAVLQAQLNAKMPKGSQKLPVDGDFGSRTYAAVVAFQKTVQLTSDGVVGPKTHTALAAGLTLSTANHAVKLIPQPTDLTCWAAATAMITRSTVPLVIAKTPADMIKTAGDLKNYSNTDKGVVEGQRYGLAHGLRCYAPMSWTVSALVSALGRSPLMFDTLWKSTEYASGLGSPGHTVIVSALVSDNNPTGEGTHLLVLDPWSPNVGKISWVTYKAWVNEVPTRTYRTFERV